MPGFQEPRSSLTTPVCSCALNGYVGCGPERQAKLEERRAKDTIGIDVSKDRLDAFWHACEALRARHNSPLGFIQLYDCVGQNDGVLFLFAATGAYHGGLERRLGLAGPCFIKVNPRQARRFAQAVGRLARTNSVDARMLARLGVVPELASEAA